MKCLICFFQSTVSKDEGYGGITAAGGKVGYGQSTLPALGIGYNKHSTYGTTLPKIPVATTTTHKTTFPTSFPSIINQEKNKVKVLYLSWASYKSIEGITLNALQMAKGKIIACIFAAK